MGRTIHDTMGVAQAAEEADWADPAIPKAIAAEMRQNWLRQQAIRAGERRVRRQGALAPPPVDPATVPIIVEHDAPYVFHAVTEEDIREVLALLPPGSLDGLREIRLCVDGEDVEGATTRDPFTGRFRLQVAPGVFFTKVHGLYHQKDAIIRLHAYVGRPGPDNPLTLQYKSEALLTLVHEAAHHFDHTFRKRRSRWATGDRDKGEAWARKVEDEEAHKIVFTYMVKRYRDELTELSGWFERHAGVEVEPGWFVLFDTAPSRVLAWAVWRGDDIADARATIARALHRMCDHDRAQAVVDVVLAATPDHADALAVGACIRFCLKRDVELAEQLARRAVTLAPASVEAWDVLIRGYANHRRWPEAARACEDAIGHTPAGERPRWYFVTTLAEAHLRLADWAGFDAAVERISGWGDAIAARTADAYQVLGLCLRERWEPAFQLATRLLAGGQHTRWAEWLAGARFESAHRLGRPGDAGGLNDAALRSLERGYLTKEWGQRIRGLLDR